MSRVGTGAKRPLLARSELTTPATSNAGGPEPCQPNGTTAIGTAASLPSLITTLKPCASATDASSAHSAAAEAIHPARALVLNIRTITTPLLDLDGKFAATSFVRCERDREVAREHRLARRLRQRRRREHRVLDRAPDGVVAVALPDLGADDVARRQLHDVDQALDAGARAQRPLPASLHG